MDTSNGNLALLFCFIFGEVVELLFQGKLSLDNLIVKISLFAGLCGIYLGASLNHYT